MEVSVSSIARSRSSQPFSAAASTIANSPLIWYAATGTSTVARTAETTSRFTGRISDLVTLLDELDTAGVVFRSATEPFDTSTPAGRMLVQMLGASSLSSNEK